MAYRTWRLRIGCGRRPAGPLVEYLLWKARWPLPPHGPGGHPHPDVDGGGGGRGCGCDREQDEHHIARRLSVLVRFAVVTRGDNKA